MKDLSIEEKAKRYDEALKQIKECTPDENGFITIYPQEIFPELKGCNKSNHQMKTIRERALEYGLKHGDYYREDFASLEYAYEQGMKDLLKEVEFANSLGSSPHVSHARIMSLIRELKGGNDEQDLRNGPEGISYK